MINSHCLMIIFFLILTSCGSLSQKAPVDSQKPFSQLSKVSLGDSKSTVLSKLGQPTSKSTEDIQSKKYETWSYSNSDGLPLGYISIEPESGLVSGRTIWVSEKQPEEDFLFLQKYYLPGTDFEEFETCDRHWGTKLKIDRKQGILVGVRGKSVFMSAWGDQRLTKLWIEQLGMKCPEGKKY